MSETPAGTPEQKQDDRPTGTPAQAQDDSVTVSKQFQKEALEHWKPAAEEANRLKKELEAKEARVAELERLAYGGGARQATDPRAELYAQLNEQAQFDPVAKAAQLALERGAVTEAELWLARATADVPASKRDKVQSLIRMSNYQMSPEQALSTVSDPEAEATAKRLAEVTAENERLRNAKPNGSSPAATPPASASAGEDDDRDIKYADYVATLRQGGQAALDLKRAVNEGRRKLVQE